MQRSLSFQYFYALLKNKNYAEAKNALKEGFDINSRDKEGYTLLHRVISEPKLSNEGFKEIKEKDRFFNR